MQTTIDAIYSPDTSSFCPLPMFAEVVAAGFPSPATDYVEQSLDLNQHLIKNPASTFIVRASGTSMTAVGIFPKDLLIVDRSLKAIHGDVVIATVDGEFLVKTYSNVPGKPPELLTENPTHRPVVIGRESEVVIWGVVTDSIRRLRKR